MEHIIQFGVTIDDDKIEKQVTETAAKEILNQIEHDIKGNYYNEGLIHRLVNKESQDFLEAHKTEIIEEASKKLAEKLSRCKAVREATELTIEKTFKEE